MPRRKSNFKHKQKPKPVVTVPDHPRKVSPSLPAEAAGSGIALMTSTEVAESLRISTRTLSRLIATDQLPGVIRIGGMNMFDKNKLMDWIASGGQLKVNVEK